MGLRDRQSFGRVIGGTSRDDGDDIIIIGFRIFKSLYDNRPNTVSAAVPICIFLPDLAL